MLVPTCPTSEEWTLWERSTHKFIAKWQAPACGEKECSHYRVKKVRKCALNREWRSSDVFKVKRREVEIVSVRYSRGRKQDYNIYMS